MDPLRLRHDGDDLERDLLGSASDDRPAPGAREQLLELLGVAGLAGTAAAIGLTGKRIWLKSGPYFWAVYSRNQANPLVLNVGLLK